MVGEPPFQLAYYRREKVYGSSTEPTHPGCGFVGPGPTFTPVRGGGVVHIDLSGSIDWGSTGEGKITANGEPSNSTFTGGSSGGSVWIKADSAMVGTGAAISAHGGSASARGGGGAGGRIALPARDRGIWESRVAAAGGAADGIVLETISGQYIQGGHAGSDGTVTWI